VEIAMITSIELKKLCIPLDRNKAYYRPLICKGELSKADIFFVGINPATPISEKDLKLEEYVSLLLDYDKFISFYKLSRAKKGKTEFSRTRIGINSFMQWLNTKTESSIIETEIIPYPTENLKLLWKEPSHIINRGKDIFFELLMLFTPKILIIHGKETVEQLIETLSSKGILLESSLILDQTIEEIEARVPFTSFKYPNGKECFIVACRHFMYYGNIGDSFSSFRDKFEVLLKSLYKNS
jgi:hypothetical protein